MKITLLSVVALSIILVAAGTTFGHHGTQISYQLDKTVNLTGTITDWTFGFPHPSVFFDVKDEGGKVTKWGGELLPTPASMRSWNVGWSRTTIKAGDTIELGCNPAKSGAPVCVVRSMKINGKQMPLNGAGQRGAAAPAAGARGQ